MYGLRCAHRDKSSSPYCSLSWPKSVVYMPQISTHKHHSLEGCETASRRSLATDYALIYVVWILWAWQAMNNISEDLSFGENKYRGYYSDTHSLEKQHFPSLHPRTGCASFGFSFVSWFMVLTSHYFCPWRFIPLSKLASVSLYTDEVWVLCEDRSWSLRSRESLSLSL